MNVERYLELLCQCDIKVEIELVGGALYPWAVLLVRGDTEGEGVGWTVAAALESAAACFWRREENDKDGAERFHRELLALVGYVKPKLPEVEP